MQSKLWYGVFILYSAGQTKSKNASDRLFLARDRYAIARYMPSPVRPSIRLSVRHTCGSVKDA